MASKLRQPAQGEHVLAERASNLGPGPGYRLLDSVTERYSDDDLERLRQQLRTACGFFPHLAPRTVTVGVRSQPDQPTSDWNPYASAEMVNHFVRFPPDGPPSNQTVFHELAHLEIYERERNGADLPTTSEEFCSIYAVARMTPGLLFRDDIAYLGEPSVSIDEWPAICRRGLEYREEHGANSHYVQQVRGWLDV